MFHGTNLCRMFDTFWHQIFVQFPGNVKKFCKVEITVVAVRIIHLTLFGLNKYFSYTSIRLLGVDPSGGRIP